MTRAVDDLMARLPILEAARAPLEQAIEVACAALRGGGKLLVCGNGGSASDSEHLVADLMKGFMSPVPSRPQSSASLVAEAGDRGAEVARAAPGRPASPLAGVPGGPDDRHRQRHPVRHGLRAAGPWPGHAGDVLIAISTSGDSPSVVNAAIVARAAVDAGHRPDRS